MRVVKIACLRCNGLGRLTVWIYTRNALGTPKDIRCPACRGRGKVKVRA